ncbi:MAG TPA: hypothetical protein VFE96_04910, partial [Candidatus Bathyarchaeia archaeon]|nr:hypothetical protein [Candidatus Bathyarchaeia archaeon]
MTILILGTISVLAGLAVAAYGANNFAFLTCRLTSLGSCFYPQYLGDQIRTSGFQAVYVGSQEAAYGGLLLASMGSMVVAFWRTRTMQLSQRVTLVLLVGIFLIVLSTALAIAMGYIPFGQRANYLG